MAQTVQIVRITREAPSGKVRVFWSDGSDEEYAGLEVLRDTVFIDQTVQNAKYVALARVLAVDPDLTDLDAAIGTYKFDLTALQPIQKLS